jgi:hypothetical protein
MDLKNAEGPARPLEVASGSPAKVVLGRTTGRGDSAQPVSFQAAQGSPDDPAEDDPTENSRWIVLEEMARIGYRIGALSQILIASAELGDCARAHDAFADFVSCGAALRNADDRLSRLLGLAGRR